MKSMSLNFCLSVSLLLSLVACGESRFYSKKKGAEKSADSGAFTEVDALRAATLRNMPIVDVIDMVLKIIPKNTSSVDGLYIGDSYEKIEGMRDPLLAFSDQYANMGEMLDALAPHQELRLTEAEVKGAAETAVAKFEQMNFAKPASVDEESSYQPAFELQDYQPVDSNRCTVLKAIGSDKNRDHMNQWAVATCDKMFISFAAKYGSKTNPEKAEGDIENQAGANEIGTDENGVRGVIAKVAGMAFVASGLACAGTVSAAIVTGVSATYVDANCEKREAAKRNTPK